MVLRVAYNIVHDRNLAEDAVQEAFIRSFKAIQSFDLTRPFGPWLSRIVVNEAIRLANQHHKGGQPAEIPDQVAPAIAAQHEVERAFNTSCANAWRICHLKCVRWSRSSTTVK